MFLLETFKAGLSWITILKKRESFKIAFDNFDVNKIARYDENKIEQLMENKDIIRNRRKIVAAIKNAKIFIEIQNEFGSFSKYKDDTIEILPSLNILVNPLNDKSLKSHG